MSNVGRLLFATQLAFSMSIVGLIYVRGFLPIADMVGQGPFTAPVEVAKTLVPITVAGFLFCLALYVIFGPVQQERTAQREVRRRR